MSSPESSRRPQPLLLALAFSLLFHAAALLYPVDKPRQEARPSARMEARLAPGAAASVEPPAPPAAAAPAPAQEPAQRKRLALARPKDRTEPPMPRESPARRREMNQFLAELGDTARSAPNLASRSLAMGREMATQPGREEGESVFLERIPDTPPVDPFSLEMYLDSLVKKLNRSASFVKNDVRVRGLRTAALQVRINPDGSLNSFDVVDAGDQQAEVGFVRSVVDRAIPFAAFPPDMRSSTRSLTMTICILPASWGSGGAGFSRQAEGKGC